MENTTILIIMVIFVVVFPFFIIFRLFDAEPPDFLKRIWYMIPRIIITKKENKK